MDTNYIYLYILSLGAVMKTIYINNPLETNSSSKCDGPGMPGFVLVCLPVFV